MPLPTLRALWRFFLDSYVLHCALALAACLLTWWTVSYFDTELHWAEVSHEPILELAMRSVERQLTEPFNYVYLIPFVVVALFWWSRISRRVYLALTIFWLVAILVDGPGDRNLGPITWGNNFFMGMIATIHVAIAGAWRLWKRYRAP